MMKKTGLREAIAYTSIEKIFDENGNGVYVYKPFLASGSGGVGSGGDAGHESGGGISVKCSTTTDCHLILPGCQPRIVGDNGWCTDCRRPEIECSQSVTRGSNITMHKYRRTLDHYFCVAATLLPIEL